MKRRLCAQSNSNMSAGEIYQMNDSLADLAIHNQPKSCNCDKRCDNSATRAKRRSCQENSRHMAIPAEVDGSDAERENVLSGLPVFDAERENVLSALPRLSDCFLDSPETTNDSASSRKVPTVFRWDGEGQDVYLSGSFDNWKMKIPLVRSQTGFLTIVEIPEGMHQYKYLVDGQWRCLLNEPIVDTGSGYHNNVVTVKSSDCDAFEALDIDSGVDKNHQSEEKWTQYIPPRDTGYSYLRAGPPLMPPHLLGTVLNQHTSSHCDPTMLAEPNHVVLNHLYTLSIKDGVLVLGATHRYRRKYITTLLYKPI